MASRTKESTYRNNIHLLLPIVLFITTFVACQPDLCLQQKCMKGVDDVITAGISRKSCLDECRARDWCVGVSYHALAHFCIVHNSSAMEKPVNECEGFCYSEKALWQEKTVFCDDVACDQNRATCAAGDTCKYKDCPVPVQSNGPLVLLGNLRSVGAKVAYLCSGNDMLNGEKSLTCLQNGTWSGSFPTCGSATSATSYGATTTTNTTTAASANTATTTVMSQASSQSPLVFYLFPDDWYPNATCQANWTRNQASCYSVLPNAMSSFDLAKQYCESENASVVVPNSYYENEFIKSYLYTAQPAGHDHWVGLKQGLVGVLQLMNGSNLTYTDWASGVGFVPAITCAKYASSSGYKWEPYNCDPPAQPYPYAVCEKLAEGI